MNFTRNERTRIPIWATTIVLVANGIDGQPPSLPVTLPVMDFLAQAKELQLREGAGEWDVLVYAASREVRYPLVTVHPWGNSYRRLRRAARCPGKLQRIAEWSYMRWARHLFSFQVTPPNRRIHV